MRVLLLVLASACASELESHRPYRADAAELAGDGVVATDGGVDAALDAAPAMVIALRQTSNQAVVPNASVACANGGVTLENAYYRVFDLASVGVTSTLHITEVTFGVDIATGTQSVIVRIGTYSGVPGTTLDTGATDFAGLVTPINAVYANVPASASGGFITAPITGSVAPNAKLIVEVLANTAGATFYLGASNAGQSSPGYVRAPGCGANQPYTTAALGFPNSHLLISAVGHY
jgi:hypothetical protein